MIRIIAAINKNGVIGKNNKIPWHRSGDLKFFAEKTWGGIIIMGRKTFESIGKPLHGRQNFVVSSDFEADNVFVYPTFKIALQMAKKMDRDIWIIGGHRIYQEALEIAEQILLTIVPDETPADENTVMFPDFTSKGWIPVEKFNNPYDEELTTYTLERIENENKER